MVEDEEGDECSGLLRRVFPLQLLRVAEVLRCSMFPEAPGDIAALKSTIVYGNNVKTYNLDGDSGIRRTKLDIGGRCGQARVNG